MLRWILGRFDFLPNEFEMRIAKNRTLITTQPTAYLHTCTRLVITRIDNSLFASVMIAACFLGVSCVVLTMLCEDTHETLVWTIKLR